VQIHSYPGKATKGGPSQYGRAWVQGRVIRGRERGGGTLLHGDKEKSTQKEGKERDPILNTGKGIQRDTEEGGEPREKKGDSKLVFEGLSGVFSHCYAGRPTSDHSVIRNTDWGGVVRKKEG